MKIYNQEISDGLSDQLQNNSVAYCAVAEADVKPSIEAVEKLQKILAQSPCHHGKYHIIKRDPQVIFKRFHFLELQLAGDELAANTQRVVKPGAGKLCRQRVDPGDTICLGLLTKLSHIPHEGLDNRP